MIRLQSVLITILAIIVTSCSTRPADGVYKLELYAHGDVHGCFFDTLYTDNEVRKSSLSKVYTYLNEKREKKGAEHIISIDLGDHIHGDNSTYYYNYVHNYSPGEKHLYTRIAEFISYDAIVVGNHDIEPGKEIFSKLKGEMTIPYLAANVVSSETGCTFFAPYTILEKGGLKIAVIGLTTPEVKKWLGEEKISGIDILPVKETAQKYIDEVKSVHSPHLTFLAIHAGSGKRSAEEVENPCRYIASSIDGIDGVLCAHDHIAYCGKEWNGTDSIIVINSGPYANNLSGIEIEIEISKGEITRKDLNAKLIEIHKINPDSSYISMFHDDWVKIKEFSSKRLGHIDEDINPKLIFDAPCLYSNLLHYVQLKESRAKISFVSPTKFSGVIPSGEICYNDVLNMYPFENLLYKVKMTGAQIKNYLEISYSNWKSRPVAFDCAGGIEYKVDFSKPSGNRVNILSFTDGSNFDINETYSVAMASYRANGGGDLLLEATGLNIAQLDGIVLEKYGPVRNLIYNFFTEETKTAASLAAVSKWSIIR